MCMHFRRIHLYLRFYLILVDIFNEIDFFDYSDAILNFEYIAMHCGLSRVTEPLVIDKIFRSEP